MAVLAASAANALKSTYQLLVPPAFSVPETVESNSKRKKEAIENLILAIIRIVAAIFIYSALYTAGQYFGKIKLKAVVTIGAFCFHPTATLDYQVLRGIQIFEAGAPHRAAFWTFRSQLCNQAYDQAKAEGYYFPYRNTEFFPLESRDRYFEIFDELRKKNWAVYIGALDKAIKVTTPALGRWLCALIGSSVVLHPSSSLFWLDRRMSSLSKQIAARLI